MKTIALASTLFLAVAVQGQSKPAPKPAPKPATPAAKPTAPAAPLLKNATDSLSYAIGVLDGSFFKNQGIDKVNGNLIGKGFADVISGKPLMTPEQCNEVVQVQMRKMNQAKIQPTVDAGNKFLAENKKKPGVKVTSSGLQYEVIKEGSGPKPTASSQVKVHYEGFLVDGKKFESSRDNGQPISFALNGVIAGWTEGLQLMSVGSRYKFFIPYQLAYGERTNGPIPGGSALIFDVELLEIVSSN